MKTEGEFSSYLTRKIRELGPKYKAVKLSDRFRIGLADWIIIHEGRVAALEAKFVKQLPKRGQLLKHPVTGPQMTSLLSMSMAGCRSWVLIANGPARTMAAVPFVDVPPTGNFPSDFFETTELIYTFNDVPLLLNAIFF